MGSEKGRPVATEDEYLEKTSASERVSIGKNEWEAI